MRKEEKAINDQVSIEEVLRSEQVCRLGIHDAPYPYVVPLHFVYEAGNIYFHTARQGRKIKLLAKNGHVCFEVDRMEEVVPDEEACSWATRYRSVIGVGVASMVIEEGERIVALRLLMEKYGGRPDSVFTRGGLRNVAVFRIDVREMAGKTG